MMGAFLYVALLMRATELGLSSPCTRYTPVRKGLLEGNRLAEWIRRCIV